MALILREAVIRRVREETGASLKDAKVLVESLQQREKQRRSTARRAYCRYSRAKRYQLGLRLPSASRRPK